MTTPVRANRRGSGPAPPRSRRRASVASVAGGGVAVMPQQTCSAAPALLSCTPGDTRSRAVAISRATGIAQRATGSTPGVRRAAASSASSGLRSRSAAAARDRVASRSRACSATIGPASQDDGGAPPCSARDSLAASACPASSASRARSRLAVAGQRSIACSKATGACRRIATDLGAPAMGRPGGGSPRVAGRRRGPLEYRESRHRSDAGR